MARRVPRCISGPRGGDWLGGNDPTPASVTERTLSMAHRMAHRDHPDEVAVRTARRSGKSMNPHRFDVFTRQLVTPGHRRALFKGVVVAIAVAARSGLPGVAVGQAVCRDGCADNQLCTDRGCMTPCAKHGDCRSRHDDPCVSNRCVDGFCTSAIVECLPGSECCKGECCATSCELDSDCTVFDPCRWGRCGVDGRCEFTELDSCVICASDDDCLGNGQDTVCCGSACRRPCPIGTLMGKGCECHANGSANLDGVTVHDDASG
jgi:hypothetical protein